MLLANIPSLVRVVREACVPFRTSWLTPPLSAPITGQQREQPPHRTPKTLITALHSLPTVFYPCSFSTSLIFSNILPLEPGPPPLLRPRHCYAALSCAPLHANATAVSFR